MFCTRCGIEMTDKDRYCSQCGHVAPGPATANAAPANAFQATAPPPQQMPPAPGPYVLEPPLMRARRNRKIAGVCAGIGRHFGVDPTLVRILFVVMFFCPVMPAIIPYLVCWFVMPLEPRQVVQQPAYMMPPQPLVSMPR